MSSGTAFKPYTIDRLSANRFRISGTKEYFSKNSHVAMRCDACGFPVGFHSMSYGADVPYTIEPSFQMTADLQSRMQPINVPGIVMDIECLPADSRERFEQQFKNELAMWQRGLIEPLIGVFDKFSQEPQAAARPDPVAGAVKYQLEIDMTPRRILSALSEYEREDTQLVELIYLYEEKALTAESSKLAELRKIIAVRRRQLELQQRARQASVQVAPDLPDPYTDDFYKPPFPPAQKKRRGGVMLASPGKWVDEDGNVIDTDRLDEKKKPEAEVIPIGAKRKLFLDES